MIRRPPRAIQSRSSAASDVYKRRTGDITPISGTGRPPRRGTDPPLRRAVYHGYGIATPIRHIDRACGGVHPDVNGGLSLIHISEPTRLGMISYAVFCLKKKKK